MYVAFQISDESVQKRESSLINRHAYNFKTILILSNTNSHSPQDVHARVLCVFILSVIFAELVRSLVDRMGALRQLNPKIGTEDSAYITFANDLDKLLTREWKEVHACVCIVHVDIPVTLPPPLDFYHPRPNRAH